MRLVRSHFRVKGVFVAQVQNNHFILQPTVFLSGFLFFSLVVLCVKLSLQCSTQEQTRDHLGFPHLTLQ